MAEGHAVVRWARALAPRVGGRVSEVDLPRRLRGCEAEVQGRRVTRIETRGKHLLLHLSGGRALHCHAMMWGDWVMGPPDSLELDGRVRLRLRTDTFEAAFLNGPVVELLREAELATHPRLSMLGPDILSAGFDPAEAERRLRLQPGRPLGEALLDQDAVAGIGNIFKSEALFRAGIDPRRSVGEVRPEDWARLWPELTRLMRASVEIPGTIATLPPEHGAGGETRWVYRRTRRPCLICGTSVQRFRQGRRDTYFCPQCQR